jgi:hypothetical protein
LSDTAGAPSSDQARHGHRRNLRMPTANPGRLTWKVNCKWLAINGLAIPDQGSSGPPGEIVCESKHLNRCSVDCDIQPVISERVLACAAGGAKETAVVGSSARANDQVIRLV